MRDSGDIAVSTRLTGSDQIEVVVDDRGRGITPEEKIQIFKPFFTTKEHGLGLGLSICSTIVRSHGGELNLDNNVDGGGARASITLPTRRIMVAAK